MASRIVLSLAGVSLRQLSASLFKSTTTSHRRSSIESISADLQNLANTSESMSDQHTPYTSFSSSEGSSHHRLNYTTSFTKDKQMTRVRSQTFDRVSSHSKALQETAAMSKSEIGVWEPSYNNVSVSTSVLKLNEDENKNSSSKIHKV